MSVNKIHVTNSTKISLNDRFTIIQNISPDPPSNQSNNKNGNNPRISSKNRQLLNQLDKKHNMIAALKMKRRDIKRGGKQQMNNKLKRTLKTATLRVTPNGKLRRTNSLTTLPTMKADIAQSKIKIGMRRSNSSTNLAARLGLRRNNSIQSNKQPFRSRSRSRNNTVNRSNSRSNSKQRRGNSQQRINLTVNKGQRKLNRSNFRKRSNSVNSRLGNNNIENQVKKRIGTRGAPRGRVFRRTNIQQRIGKTKSVIQNSVRNRSRSRNKGQQQNQIYSLRQRSVSRNAGTNSAAQRGRGGRQPRKRGRSKTRTTTPTNPKSKEQLDQELDQYMSNTKTALDHEMDEYMRSAET